MKSTEALPVLAVLIEAPKADYHYSDIQAYKLPFVVIESDGKVRNPSEYHDHTAPFVDLAFRAQGHVQQTDTNGNAYGWSLEYYGVYSVDLRNAERMLKWLKKIHKARENFPVQPQSYGQYVQMLCQALGVTMAVQTRGKSRGWHDENDYVTWKIKDAAWLVDNMISSFLEEQRPKPHVTADLVDVPEVTPTA